MDLIRWADCSHYVAGERPAAVTSALIEFLT